MFSLVLLTDLYLIQIYAVDLRFKYLFDLTFSIVFGNRFRLLLLLAIVVYIVVLLASHFACVRIDFPMEIRIALIFSVDFR